MLVKYFYDERLAQASYMVGCAATGEALVVDAGRDITPYLQMAEKEGLQITHVTETHIHADYVSGSRELAAATGANLYVSDMGTADWKYAFVNEPKVIAVRDGDSFMVGNIRIEVLHTPGHTPEHICFVVTDTAAADKPIGVFTGDFVFVGDVGRPDLLEEAAGIADTKEPGARDMFKSLERFKAMPDYLQIWPGHGAGSACGKALGAIPSTTLGYEKLFNPAFQYTDEDAFVEWLLDGQPEAPFYFAQMKKVNKLGPALIRNLLPPQRLDHGALTRALDEGAVVFDLRAKEDYAAAHIAGTINIPATSQGYVNYIGWFVDFNRPTYVIVPENADVQTVYTVLRSIGADDIRGYFVAEEVIVGDTRTLKQIDAHKLVERLATNDLMIVDVRGRGEFAERHMAGAVNIPLGYLPRSASEHLPKDRTLVTNCASGYRSAIAASVLRSLGYTDVVNLIDGAEAWAAVVPVE
ncbi:MAG: MBL fold metallo-hydrolase [Anaerolineaceae bacterium]|nr:MAG: MBL fold metallo-hydrolase [Anaerolineaceae bacterium]